MIVIIPGSELDKEIKKAAEENKKAGNWGAGKTPKLDALKEAADSAKK